MGSWFSNTGRDTRLAWWIRQLAVIVVPWLTLGAFYVLAFAGGALGSSVAGAFGSLLLLGGAAVYLLLCWISIMSCVRRLHDLNLSGWWCLAYIAATVLLGLWSEPLSLAVILIMTIHLGFFPGTSGTNRFGAPKNSAPAEPAMQPKAA